MADLALTLILATTTVAGLVVAARPLLRIDGPAFTSVFQGAVRFNNYVGVTLAAGLYGAKGIALAAICNAAIVPTVNILCVVVFARHGSARLTGPASPGRSRPTRSSSPRSPGSPSASSGCLCRRVGAGVPHIGRRLAAARPPLHRRGPRVRHGAGLDRPIAAASAVKFLAMPLVTVLSALALGLSGPP